MHTVNFYWGYLSSKKKCEGFCYQDWLHQFWLAASQVITHCSENSVQLEGKKMVYAIILDYKDCKEEIYFVFYFLGNYV